MLKTVATKNSWRGLVKMSSFFCFQFEWCGNHYLPLQMMIRDLTSITILNTAWHSIFAGVYFANSIEGRITECWLVNEEGVVLLYREVVAKKFCNNGVSFRDSWQRIHRRIKSQERNENTKKSMAVLEERFQMRVNERNFQTQILAYAHATNWS